MSIYKEIRLGFGNNLVTVDGHDLPHVVKHSPTGLEWGYGGSGPSDLALSVLTHYFGFQGRAERYYMDFKRDVVAGWGPEWKITTDEIDRWLATAKDPYA